LIARVKSIKGRGKDERFLDWANPSKRKKGATSLEKRGKCPGTLWGPEPILKCRPSLESSESDENGFPKGGRGYWPRPEAGIHLFWGSKKRKSGSLPRGREGGMSGGKTWKGIIRGKKVFFEDQGGENPEPSPGKGKTTGRGLCARRGKKEGAPGPPGGGKVG